MCDERVARKYRYEPRVLTEVLILRPLSIEQSSHFCCTSEAISQKRTRVKLNKVFFSADYPKPVPFMSALRC